MNDLTLIEKIRREQAETAADLEKFLESEKQILQADLEAIREKEVEISELIEQLAEKQRSDSKTVSKVENVDEF